MKEIIIALVFLMLVYFIMCIAVKLTERFIWSNTTFMTIIGIASYIYAFLLFWNLGAMITMYEEANIVGILMVVEGGLYSMYKVGWKGWLGFGAAYLASSRR